VLWVFATQVTRARRELEMSSKLSGKDIDLIVKTLDVWTGTLTWDLLVGSISHRLGTSYTRQALDRHWRIKRAFQSAKIRLRGATGSESTGTGTAVQQALQQHAERLEVVIERMKSEADALDEQFYRWAFNAHSHGMTKEQLNRPLPAVNRKKSRR